MDSTLYAWLTVAAGAYILGSIPTGYLLGRLRGVDIRRLGSGNIGATNVFRCLGKKLGILTLVVDGLKGLIPVLAARQWLDGGVAGQGAVLAAALAVIGHVWPVTMGFKGGKGVATAAGGLAGVVPIPMAWALAVWVALFLGSGYVSMASMGAALTVAVVTWIMVSEAGWLIPGIVTLLALITLWRHRGNLARLRNGTESQFRVWRRRKQDAS